MRSGHDDHFLMKCCNAKSNSLYQVQYVRIQDKFIVQDFVITIYRSKHAGVSYSKGIKPRVHESYQLLRGAIN